MNKNLTKIFFFLALVFFSYGTFAQFTLTGTIMDDTNTPMIGANIIIKDTSIGTTADLEGNFKLNIPNDSETIVVTYTGYETQELLVSADSPFLEIILSTGSSKLDEIVITGLATTVKRSNAANAVARVDAKEIAGVTAVTTTESALVGKFKGAEIKNTSGAPGGGTSFKLRGTTSISGSSQPLVIVDGVYIDNSSIPAGLNVVSAAASGGSTSNQDNPSNRLADIDPNDIESVEILKGASTAAIYGSRAAGGVVIITTKRGSEGATKINFSQSLGFTEMLNPLGVREWTEERVLNSAFADDIDAYREAVADNKIFNYENELYGNKGLLSNTRISATGGSESTKFFIGATYKNEEGIVKNTGYNKVAARVNIDHKFSKNFDIALSTNYINSSADRGFFNNDNSGTTMGISFTSTPSWAQLQANSEGFFPSNPYAPSNFLETAALITNNESVNRFIGGGTATYKIFTNNNSSLKAIFRGGNDFYNLSTAAIFPNTLQFQRDGAGLNGVSVQASTKNLNTNLALFLVHNQYLSNGLSFTTSAGITQENFNRNTILGTASNLIGVQTNLDQAGSRNVIQDRLIQVDKGFFVQEEINFNDLVIATLGLRGDKSSNNGDVNQLYFYPKGNIAFNISKLGFWNTDAINLLKLRAAYGESGNFARFGSKSTIMNSIIVDGVPGVGVPDLQGNSEVGPERQKELEFGFDAGFNNRYALDFTYYIKTVEDLLLNADLPASSGFSNQVTNAAQLQNKGIEVGLNLNLVSSKTFDWSARIGWWKNQAKVTELLVPAFTTGGFADFLGNYMVKEGYSPTTIIGVGSNPDVTLNGDGDPTLQVFGDAEPDFQMSFNNQMSFKGFDFSMAWHWKQGGENINLSALLFDLNETTYDFDDTDLDPAGILPNGPYRLDQLGVNTEPYIEDAGYLRLREVGLYYHIPTRIIGGFDDISIGVSANNLINIFDYRSYDPEVSNFGGGGLSTGVEVTPFPSSKRYDFHLRISF